MTGDDRAPRVPAGWTLDEERRLGDHLQEIIRKGAASRTAQDEDADAEQIMKAALDGWNTPGDDE